MQSCQLEGVPLILERGQTSRVVPGGTQKKTRGKVQCTRKMLEPVISVLPRNNTCMYCLICRVTPRSTLKLFKMLGHINL